MNEDIISLDEAIEHAREASERIRRSGEVDCASCADEHLQLARWLEELRTYRAQVSIINNLKDYLKSTLLMLESCNWKIGVDKTATRITNSTEKFTSGQKIRNARINAGLTQAQLSERSGVGRSTLGSYEMENVAPTYIALVKLAKVLGCSADDLVGRAPDKRVVEDRRQIDHGR